jgi:hypothetical protein
MSVKCKRPNLFYSPPAVVVLVYAWHAWRHESVDVTSKKSGVEDRHHFDDDHMHMHATRSHVWSLPVVANRAELSLLYCDNDLHCILRLQQGGPWMGARAACHCFTCVCLLTKKINKNLVSMPMSEYNILGCRKETFRYRSVGRWTGRVISLVHPQCVSPSARARMGLRGRDGGEQEQRRHARLSRSSFGPIIALRASYVLDRLRVLLTSPPMVIRRDARACRRRMARPAWYDRGKTCYFIFSLSPNVYHI